VGQIDLARVANDDLEGQVRRAREQSAVRDQTELLLREALTKSEDESARRLNVLTQHEAELEQARARIRSLEEQLKGTLERNDQLSISPQSSSSDSSLMASSTRTGVQESELAAAQHRLNELTAKLERSSAEVLSLQRQLAEGVESTQAHINNLDGALNYERDQNSDLLARLGSLQGENLALRSELEQARKQWTEVESKWWFKFAHKPVRE
jgi:chromosome segregation ATPase